MLVIAAMVLSRDYKDSWVLEGLEIPFAVFMITNVAYFLVEKDSKYLVIFATVTRVVIGLLPNLKYEWFLGAAIDQHQQFRAARFVCDYGSVESGRGYSATPLMHIFFAIFSEVTNISLLTSFKYLPVISWSIYPIIMYSIVKRIFPEKEKIVKFALFISILPIDFRLSYVVTGTLFGSLFAFLVIAEFTAASATNDRRYLFLALFFSLALVLSHFISSDLLMIGFVMVFLANKIFKFFHPRSIDFRFTWFLVLMNSAWLIPQLISESGYTKTIALTLSNFIRGIMGLDPMVWSPTGIRLRFFDLHLMDAIRVLVVYYGGSIIIILLATLGIVIGIKKLGLTSKSMKFMIIYFVSLLLFVPVQLMLTAGKAGLVQYFRIIRQTLVICPLFIAFLLYYINKTIRRPRAVVSLGLLMIIALSSIQMYGYEPLLPRSSAISKNLPTDEPIDYLGWSDPNSIYQRLMIRHIEDYSSGEVRLASDDTTSNQVFGLSDYDFSVNQLIGYNPLTTLIDENVVQRSYDIFLIHLPGKAGGLAEKAEIRTEKLILETIYNSSVLYNNGESYILIYPVVK